MNEWQQEWQPTERDNRLHELATRYHTECEAYDQTVCTGPMGQDGIMPANPHEMALINRNAHAVRKRLTEEAAREGIEREELARAISKWRGSVPNAIWMRHGYRAVPLNARDAYAQGRMDGIRSNAQS